MDKVEDVVNVGDEIEVKLLEMDPRSGKMRLSRKALIEKPEGYVEPERRPRPEGPRGGHSSQGRPGDRRPSRN